MTHKWGTSDIAKHWSDSVTNGIDQMHARNAPGKFVACAQMLMKMINNVLEHPDDPKYRQIRARNEKVRTTILSCDWAEYTLEGLGFKREVIEMEVKYTWVPGDTGEDRLRLGRDQLAKYVQGINEKASYDPKEQERRQRDAVMQAVREDEAERERARVLQKETERAAEAAAEAAAQPEPSAQEVVQALPPPPSSGA